MMTVRKNDGFTLVELMVVILVSSIVTLAATSVLLLGLRINSQSNRIQKTQNNTRILMTALQDMASEGTIKKVVPGDSWKILGDGDAVLLSYDPDSAAICLGDGSALLEGMGGSSLSLTDNLLTISVTIDEEDYSTSIYCRTGVTEETETNEAAEENLLAVPAAYSLRSGSASADAESDSVGLQADMQNKVETALGAETAGTARAAFLDALTSQYSTSRDAFNTGLIQDNGGSTGVHYAQWYITARYGETAWENAESTPDGSTWNEDTPWCACFVSWGLAALPEAYVAVPEDRANENGPFWYGNVDDFMDYFTNNNPGPFAWRDAENPDTPAPGDIIFFGANNDPNHVGVVLYTEKGNEYYSKSDDYVYTIEGNSLGIVAVRRYAMDDERILGYGVLPWAANDEFSPESTI